MTVSPISKQAFTTMFWRRLIVGTGLALFFAWLAMRPQPGADDRLVKRDFLAMGTLFSVSIYRDEEQPAADAEAQISAVERMLHDYEHRWTVDGDGELGRINAALAAGETADVPRPMRTLFERAARITELSQGRFDVRVGALVRLWGFDDETRFRTAPPEAAAIERTVAALAAAPKLDAPFERYGPADGVLLDFGAIAKGDATDLTVQHLREAGYGNVIVNAGGNLRASGRRGDRAWRIGIRHPRPDASHRLLATLDIEGDEAVITSGDYERYFEYDGRRYHHLLDPHSGQPARGLQAVTVVADNGALADAASTALFVAGPGHWREQATALGLDKILVVEDSGRIVVTAALSGRLQLADGVIAETVP